MELKLKPTNKNSFPIAGILIRGSDTKLWLQEIIAIGLKINEIKTFPIPDTSANSVWGCFIEVNIEKHKIDIGKNSFCQLVNSAVYIPEYATIFPKVTETEFRKLSEINKHILHQDFGFVALTEPIDWSKCIEIPPLKNITLVQPKESAFIPTQVQTFQIKPIPMEDVLAELEKKSFPKRENLKDTSLTLIEKIKLATYKTLFSKNEKNEGEKKPFLNILENIFSKIGFKNAWVEEARRDFEDLEERNKNQINKLIDMLEKNPDEALKYALPIDTEGTSRGGSKASFEMFQHWLDFSLFGNKNYGSGGGNVTLEDEYIHQLTTQYNKMATEFIEKKNYEKAAFVYMKLLKNNYAAANTLEAGKLYSEAAAIYLKYLNNKEKAAECYEKGNMIHEAIDLYKILKSNEKVGDLYMQINMKKEAYEHYEIVAEKYKSTEQYVKAALLYKYKMNDKYSAQSLLLNGWRKNKDAYNCLNNYFENITTLDQLEKEINEVHTNDVNNKNCESFLKVIKQEFDKKNKLNEFIKNKAYEIISSYAEGNKSIVSHLQHFNKQDKRLFIDISRYKK